MTQEASSRLIRHMEGPLALSTDELVDRVTSLAASKDTPVMDMARAFRQLYERDRKVFRQLALHSQVVKYRKAYHLVEISQAFDPLPISRARLNKLGWTKLLALSKKVDKGNVEELVSQAEHTTVAGAQRIAKNQKPLNNAHCMTIRFSPKDRAMVESVFQAFGAEKTRWGLDHKEEAFAKMIKSLAKAGK